MTGIMSASLNWHFLADDHDVGGADAVGEGERRAQGFDRRRKGGEAAEQAGALEVGDGGFGGLPWVSAPKSMAIPSKPASRTWSNLAAVEASGEASLSMAPQRLVDL